MPSKVKLGESPKGKWESFYRAIMARNISNQKEYDLLANVFFQLRKNTTLQLAENLRSLSQKEKSLHPAFQSISLLKVLDGSGLRETAHTRILAWLFQESVHGFHQAPLRFLLKYLRSIEVLPFSEESILSEIKIEAERSLSDGSGRRIDIWITGNARNSDSNSEEWLIVIEAKVDADESLDQLSYYEQEAKAWETKAMKNGNIYHQPIFIYLTREGKLAKRGKKNWNPITFETISGLIWRSIKDSENAPGFHLARYYISGVLSDVCDWPLPLPRDISQTQTNQYGMLSFFEKISN